MAFSKKDRTKVDLTLFPMEAVEAVCRVLQSSIDSGKYARDNWREGVNDPGAQRIILGAMLRHYTALQRGETIDPDSGLHHIHHIACNAAFLSTFSVIHERAAQGEVEARADEIIREDEEIERDAATGNPKACGCGTCVSAREVYRAQELADKLMADKKDCDPGDCNDNCECLGCEATRRATMGQAGRMIREILGGNTVEEKVENMMRDRAAVEEQTGLDANHKCIAGRSFCVDPMCQVCF